MSELAIAFGKYIVEHCKACDIPLEIAERYIDKITVMFFQEQRILRDQALMKPIYEQWLAEKIEEKEKA